MPKTAVEHVRRMRGGAQAHLLRCADGAYCVTKFQNNPQHQRILVNEMLCGLLAQSLGLPVAIPGVVEVKAELIERTPELHVYSGGKREKCVPGFQFGSRFPGEPGRTTVYDLLPDERLGDVENLRAFAGMVLFDQWTCNTNGRQVLFVAHPPPQRGYRALMVDQGFCLNAGEWNFPDSPLRGLYYRHRVYQDVRGWESFEPWLTRLEALPLRALDEAAAQVPSEWYNHDTDALHRLLAELDRRRKWIRELILAVRNCSREPFPNWKR